MTSNGVNFELRTVLVTAKPRYLAPATDVHDELDVVTIPSVGALR